GGHRGPVMSGSELSGPAGPGAGRPRRVWRCAQVTGGSQGRQLVEDVSMTSLVLASASPARLGLLRSSGIDPHVVVSDVDEEAVGARARTDDPHLPPARLAQVLAEAKGAAVHDRLPGDGRLVLACDSVLEVDGAVHGMPGTPAYDRCRSPHLLGRCEAPFPR